MAMLPRRAARRPALAATAARQFRHTAVAQLPVTGHGTMPGRARGAGPGGN